MGSGITRRSTGVSIIGICHASITCVYRTGIVVTDISSITTGIGIYWRRILVIPSSIAIFVHAWRWTGAASRGRAGKGLWESAHGNAVSGPQDSNWRSIPIGRVPSVARKGYRLPRNGSIAIVNGGRNIRPGRPAFEVLKLATGSVQQAAAPRKSEGLTPAGVYQRGNGVGLNGAAASTRTATTTQGRSI